MNYNNNVNIVDINKAVAYFRSRLSVSKTVSYTHLTLPTILRV